MHSFAWRIVFLSFVAGLCQDGHAATATTKADSSTLAKAVSTPATSVTSVTVRQIGAGLNADLLDVDVYDADADRIAYGTSVGGVFLSRDGATSFENVSRDLPTRFVAQVRWLDTGSSKPRLLVGTDQGVFYTDDDGGTWTEANDGLITGDGDAGGAFPIRALAVDANTKGRVWAGIGYTYVTQYATSDDDVTVSGIEGGRQASKRCDPYSVYRSDDFGKTWTPALTLSAEYAASDFTTTECDTAAQEIAGPAVYDIAVHPANSSIVYVASDRGLFVLSSGTAKIASSSSWKKLGGETVQASTDLGLTWNKCSSSAMTVVSSACSVHYYKRSALKSASLAATTDKHLPFSSGDGSFPEVRGVTVVRDSSGNDSLLVTIFDNGSYGGTNSCNADKGYTDVDAENEPSAERFAAATAAGIYRSQNGGTRWGALNFGDNGTSLHATVRCAESDDIQYNTIFEQVAADPNDPEHIIVLGRERYGNSGGFFERDKDDDGLSGWRHIDQSRESSDGLCFLADNSDSNNNFDAKTCAEGNRIDGLWRDGESLQDAFAFDVSDWSGSDGGPIFFGHDKKFSWEGSAGYYGIEHVNGDPADVNSVYWTNNGLDFFCPYGVATATNGSESVLVSAAADAGPIKSTDGGKSWKILRDNPDHGTPWSELDAATHFDDPLSIVSDPDTNLVYFHNQASKFATTSNGIYRALNPDTEDFRFLGGCDYLQSGGTSACRTESDGNGYDPSHEAYDLAVDYSSPTSADERRLLAASSAGVYLYDPSGTAGNQWELLKTGCPYDDEGAGTEVTATGVLTSKEFPSLAFATITDESDSNYQWGYGYSTDASRISAIEGVYAIDLNAKTCSLLRNASESASGSKPKHVVRAPSTLAITKWDGVYYLLAGGQYNNWPSLSRMNLSSGSAPAYSSITASPSWKITAWFKFDALNNLSSDYVGDEFSDWKSYYGDDAKGAFAGIDRSVFKMMDVTALAAAPNAAGTVLVGMGENSPFLFVTKNAGSAFRVTKDFDAIPYHNYRDIRFDGDTVYFSTRCTSLFKAASPYTAVTPAFPTKVMTISAPKATSPAKMKN